MKKEGNRMTKKIIVWIDMDRYVSKISQPLKEAGCEVKIIADRAEALEKAVLRDFFRHCDAIIIDPLCFGKKELEKIIRKIRTVADCQAPIIFYSSHPVEEFSETELRYLEVKKVASKSAVSSTDLPKVVEEVITRKALEGEFGKLRQALDEGKNVVIFYKGEGGAIEIAGAYEKDKDPDLIHHLARINGDSDKIALDLEINKTYFPKGVPPQPYYGRGTK